MRYIVMIGAFAMLAVSHAAWSTDSVAEEDAAVAIEHLLRYAATSDLVFIRNGEEYPGADAADHMRNKYDHFRKKKEIRTPEDFIRLAGTKSLLSGKFYEVRLKDGEVMRCSDWLTEELRRYRGETKAEPEE